MRRVIILAVAALTTLFVNATTAFAAGSGEDKFDNFGNLIEHAAKDIWKISGLIAIGLLLMKKYEAMMVFVAGAVVCGMFIFANGAVVNIIRALANSIS